MFCSTPIRLASSSCDSTAAIHPHERPFRLLQRRVVRLGWEKDLTQCEGKHGNIKVDCFPSRYLKPISKACRGFAVSTGRIGPWPWSFGNNLPVPAQSVLDEL